MAELIVDTDEGALTGKSRSAMDPQSNAAIAYFFKEETDFEKWARKAQVKMHEMRVRACCGGVHPHDRNRYQLCLARIVETRWFEALCALVIMLNCVHMTIDTNHSVQLAIEGKIGMDARQATLQDIGICFAAFYVIEWPLRVALYQLEYFLGPNWKWNVLDTILVALALQEVLQFFFASDEASNNFTFIRIVRVVKIAKAFRIVRLLRVFRELRLMLSLVLGCARSMSWGVTLILLVSFLFGICFTQAAVFYLTSPYPKEENTYDAMLLYWGTVGMSMNSLFMASTSGESWNIMAKPLLEVGVMFYIAFLLYLLFFLIVILNTLTGIFLDATCQNALADQQHIIMEELRKKSMYVKHFKEVWAQLDDDHSGDVSLEELALHMKDPRLAAFLSNLEIDICDVVQFFDALSHEGHTAVDAETFVDGCLKLKGTARSVDLYGLIQSNRKAMIMQDNLTRRCLQEVQQLRRRYEERQEEVRV